jgi:hypothetical protein
MSLLEPGFLELVVLWDLCGTAKVAKREILDATIMDFFC